MLPLIFAILIVVFAVAYSFVWFLCRASARANEEVPEELATAHVPVKVRP